MARLHEQCHIGSDRVHVLIETPFDYSYTLRVLLSLVLDLLLQTHLLVLDHFDQAVDSLLDLLFVEQECSGLHEAGQIDAQCLAVSSVLVGLLLIVLELLVRVRVRVVLIRAALALTALFI